MTVRNQLDELLKRKQLLESRAIGTPGFVSRLRELSAWQAARLSRTYDDLHADPRYSGAVDFFLRDLYGPQDFTDRDRELTRALRYLKRALPAAALNVLERAIELQVVTAELDHAMVSALAPGSVTDRTYAAAYHRVGRRDVRMRQIDLVVAIGEDLIGIVRHTWIALALRAAHGPARAAGFAELQSFLERGFATFRELKSPQDFLFVIRAREMNLMNTLLGGDRTAGAAPSMAERTDV